VNLTFHTPKSLRFSSIGRLVQADTQGTPSSPKWVSELPTNQVSFNIGSFDEVRDHRSAHPAGDHSAQYRSARL